MKGGNSIVTNLYPDPKQRISRTALTLMELLVVISIMVIITAMTLPRLRVFNEDRNIREAGRQAASMFAAVSQQAIGDGTAGIMIERNPNLIDADGVRFAGTRMFRMRAVPPFIGDGAMDRATRTGDYQLTIPKPLEYDSNRIVDVHDQISVNNGSLKYHIRDIRVQGTAPNQQLLIDLSEGEGAQIMPALPASINPYPFVVHRQPRIVVSSEIQLPEGYLIDLRYSGPINANTIRDPSVTEVPRCYFHDIIKPGYTNQARAANVSILFNKSGLIDRYFYYDPDLTINGEINSQIPLGSMYFLMTKIETEPTPNHGILNNEGNLWITVAGSSGGVNVGYNAIPSGAVDMDGDGNVGTLGDRILEARGIAAMGQNAAQ